MHNVFACLVHESPECVVDLVRNLRHFDPESPVLLYDGGRDAALLDAFPFARYGAVAHPRPRPLEWGKLHDFAFDALRFALATWEFDALTIVDSDQLLVRDSYSALLARALAGRSRVGLLGSSPSRQEPGTKIGPAAAAFREIDLWRPWLRRFPGGEAAFGHWTFWPSTAFTAAAARDLVDLVDSDAQLRGLLQRTRIWATEEVILPSLVALLGYEIAASPSSQDFVQFRKSYDENQIDHALDRPDVYWLHPVPRRYDDPLRRHVRERSAHYERASGGAAPAAGEAAAAPALPEPGLLATLPILERMRRIDGWLEDEEADLLIAAAARALANLPAPPASPVSREPAAVVEVGSYCGRSTVVLGSVVRTLRPDARVYAIDPHQGEVGAVDQGLERRAPTLARLQANLAAAALAETVEVIAKRSYEVAWDGRPIALLFVDGLHDYVNVARDFFHFEAAVATGGYVAFHDYAPYYPGVRALVDELLAGGRYRKVQQARSLVVVRKVAAQSDATKEAGRGEPGHPGRDPRASCIMPTRDRRPFVPRAIAHFLGQDDADAELIVVDDGADAVADLIPADPRIRYLRLAAQRSIGAKRNLACEQARGEIVLHWDDDDWMAPRRLRVQVEALLGAGADVCGLPRLYYHDPAAGLAWEYACPRRDKLWLAGATLCYRRELWRRNPFPDTSVGEDTQFLWSDRPKSLLPLDDPTLYVARLHPGSTSAPVPGGPGWRPLDVDLVRRLMAADEAAQGAPVAPPAAAAAPPAVPREAPAAAPSVHAAGASRPRVSCVMPTRNRRRLVPQAIAYFLRQDCRDGELVIVDDGTEPLADLLPADDRIRYVHLDAEASIGAKRDLGVERSRGEIVVHWDDDDWSAADRLSYQLAPLLAGEAEICGLATGFFYSVEEQTFWRCTPELHSRMFFADVHGRSLAYRREVWERHARYPDSSLGEDARFLEAALARGQRLLRLPNPGKFVYVRHAASAWRFRCGEFISPAGWRQIPPRSFLSAADLAFYRGWPGGAPLPLNPGGVSQPSPG
jgi:glycosyltransferase involved in cell wall biosynthesis